MRIGENGVIRILKNINELGMQSWFSTHEVDNGSIFDFRKKFVLEIFIFHGFSGCLHRLLHILVCKTVIAF
jgi:hypothetical protein